MRRVVLHTGAIYVPTPDLDEADPDELLDAELEELAAAPDDIRPTDGPEIDPYEPNPTAPISPYGATTWSNRR